MNPRILRRRRNEDRPLLGPSRNAHTMSGTGNGRLRDRRFPVDWVCEELAALLVPASRPPTRG